MNLPWTRTMLSMAALMGSATARSVAAIAEIAASAAMDTNGFMELSPLYVRQPSGCLGREEIASTGRCWLVEIC